MEREIFVTTEPTVAELAAICAEKGWDYPHARELARQLWRIRESALLNPLRELRMENEAERQYRLEARH